MDERNHNYNDPWDDGVYGTGRTNPPKNHGSAFALLLILVIFLCGIVTLLGILNVRLFQQLSRQEQEENLSISFIPETSAATEPFLTEVTEATDTAVMSQEDVHIDLHNSPESIENIPQEGGLPLQEIYEKNIGSVVSISCQSRLGASTGTGVILTSDGSGK